MDNVTFSMGETGNSLFKRLRFAFLRLRFALTVFACSVFVVATTPISNAAETKYAAYVVHADSRDAFFDRYSQDTRYPASLTKMMTLYLLFEELDAGRLTLKSKLTVSKTAAAQPPSKLGNGVGSTIDVETAIQSLVVKSANDIAVVVAEKIGGSEWQFAKTMTAKARALGMSKTTFRNASGLPHSKQLTTARDMAELGRRLFQDFPQYQHYFSLKSFEYKNRTYTTHNSLVKTYPGADGLKTGYTRLSGFNLVTTAVQNDQRLIGVVLGGRSSYTRDKHMREILDVAFAKLVAQPDLISGLFLRTPQPRLKPSPFGDDVLVNSNPHLQATLVKARDAFGADQNASTDDLNRAQIDRLAILINREDNSYAIAEGDFAEGDNEDGLTYEEPDISRILANTLKPTFSVQIGAYSSEDYALEQLEGAAVRASLTGTTRRIIPLQSNQKTALYRARFFFDDKNAAEKGCANLKEKGIGCFVTNDPAE